MRYFTTTIALLPLVCLGQLVQCVNEFHGNWTTGEQVFRIYLELEDGDDFVQSVVASGDYPINIGSDIGGLMNEANGSITGDLLPLNFCPFVADVCMDSYVTIGYAGTDAGTDYFPDETPIGCGSPINVESTLPNSTVVHDSFAGGGLNPDFLLEEGSWSTSLDPGCADNGFPHGPENRVMIAQVAIPVGAELQYDLNVVILDGGNPDVPLIYLASGSNPNLNLYGLTFPGSACVPGCTDPEACNYDSAAPCDDGSCLYHDCLGECGGWAISGCTDTVASNYNPNADCDDGSCVYCAIGEDLYTFEMFDSLGDGWNGATAIINDWEGGTVYDVTSIETAQSGDGLSYGANHYCLPVTCLHINVGGGISDCEINWQMSSWGVVINTNIGYAPQTHNFSYSGSQIAVCNNSGCHDPAAINHEWATTYSDSSLCVYVYPNTSLEMNMYDSGLNGWQGGSYQIENLNNGIIYSSGDLDSAVLGNGVTQGTNTLCLAEGCYRMSFVAGSSPEESIWTLGEPNSAIMFQGTLETPSIEFTIGEIECIAGCTLVDACNYDSSANIGDNESCYFPDACGVCEGTGTIAGCTDPDFPNYNPDADCDDGSCCALKDLTCDGSVNTADLLMLITLFGCELDCQGDFNLDGVVNTHDILCFLTSFN